MMMSHLKHITRPAFAVHVLKPTFTLHIISPEVTNKSLHSFVCKRLDTVLKPNKLSAQTVYHNINRWKSKKPDVDSDDEDGVFDDDASLSKDSKVVKFSTQSLRTDQILKSALGVARNKIEQQFYESKIRVNGKKIMKKSTSVKVGDEIDIIKMVSPKNPDHLYVSRVEILNLVAKENAIAVSARRFKNLLIENYQEDPYKGASESTN